jgi:hypothetical protein
VVALLKQHIWYRSSPHGSHRKFVLHAPLSQAFPAQQACPGPPQVGSSQVEPARTQATPAPQLWAQQMPLVALQIPLWQSLCSSHGCPFARSATQFPPSQCAPPSQTSPAQHARPTAPQGGTPQVNPAPVQSTPAAQSWPQQTALTPLQNPLWQSLAS